MKSAPMNLPGKNAINALMGLGTAGAGALVVSTGDPALGLAALGGTALLSSMAGWHMTASIGGACPVLAIAARLRVLTCARYPFCLLQAPTCRWWSRC